jgi:hypothetical protein
MDIIITIFCVVIFGYFLKKVTKTTEVGKKMMHVRSLTIPVVVPTVAAPTKKPAEVDYDTPTYQRKGVVIDFWDAPTRTTSQLFDRAVEALDECLSEQDQEVKFEVIA